MNYCKTIRSFPADHTCAAVIFLVGLLSVSAAAQTPFTDPVSFNAGIAGLSVATVVNFDELDAGPAGDTYLDKPPFDGNHYAALGISFAPVEGQALYIAPGGVFWNESNSLSVDRFPFDPAPGDQADSLRLAFAQPQYAVGFTLVDAAGGQYVNFLDAGGSMITRTDMPEEYSPNRRFVGLISTNQPIASVEVVDGANDGDDVVYDDFTFVAAVRLDFQLLNNALVLSWTNAGFHLQTAPAVTGPFTNLPAATSPYTNSLTAPQQFFRLKAN